MKTDFPGLKAFSQGKVRDTYEADEFLVMVATDRISAFDVVMPNPIPGKGRILTRMSTFWFEKTKDIIANHLITTDVGRFPEVCRPYADVLEERSMLIRKASPLPVECIVRGYLSGSAWKDYAATKTISGIRLPEGLKESAKLEMPIFTPSTKAQDGAHDLPITRPEMEDMIGQELTARVIEASIRIYRKASIMADEQGIIIADTKMEFGLIEGGDLILIDELLTPDSSRFWPRESYESGGPQKSFDKQFLRDYLLSLKWDQKPPAPELPPNIIEKTKEKYEEALSRLVKENSRS
jgi:phosphoribosylaminoimidazole-succinocarboxamide synthase